MCWAGQNRLVEMRQATRLYCADCELINLQDNKLASTRFEFYTIIISSENLSLLWCYIQLTPWLIELGGSMSHSQGLSNDSYPEPNQPNAEGI